MAQDSKTNSSSNTNINSNPNSDEDTNSTASTSPSGFAHLRKLTQVQSKISVTWIVGGVTFLAIIALIIFMLSGSNTIASKKQSSQGMAVDNANIIQQNEKHLKELQALEETDSVSDSHSSDDSKDAKKMESRRNAPTQMYAAEMSNSEISDGTNQTDSNTHNAVLADTGAFSKFANSQAASIATVEGEKISHPRYTIVAGEFIHAVLETAINSDLPGMVRAVVTRPVYAYVGDLPLIPAGSRLIGQYTSLSSNGSASTRVFVIWNCIITPSGISMMVNSLGADSLGRAGMGADSIDTHFGKMFGTAALLSVLSATTATAGVSNYTQPNSANEYQQSISASFQEAAQNSLSQNLAIQPTLHIYQGDSVNVFVAHNIDLFNVLADSQHHDDSKTYASPFNSWNFIQ